MTTYRRHTGTTPTRSALPMIISDPASALNAPPTGNSNGFKGNAYIEGDCANVVALATGSKIQTTAITCADFGNPPPFITESVRAAGESTSAMTRVRISHVPRRPSLRRTPSATTMTPSLTR